MKTSIKVYLQPISFTCTLMQYFDVPSLIRCVPERGQNLGSKMRVTIFGQREDSVEVKLNSVFGVLSQLLDELRVLYEQIYRSSFIPILNLNTHFECTQGRFRIISSRSKSLMTRAFQLTFYTFQISLQQIETPLHHLSLKRK